MTEPETSTRANSSSTPGPEATPSQRSGRSTSINPIEVVILGSITLLLGQGILNLFDAKKLTPTLSQSPTAGTGGRFTRSPAGKVAEVSTPPKLAQLEIRCDTGKIETASTRVRLSGPLCGMAEGGSLPETRRLVKSHVLNQANHYQATVFSDLESGKFTTDYIPLVTGANTFKVEFTYASGKHATHELVVLKN